MSEWKVVRLGEICSRVFSGGTPSKSNSAFYEHGNIPWLNTGEVNFQDIYSTENCITQAGYDKSAAKWVEPNSIIIAMYGATAGRSCITRIRLTTNQACCNLQINDKVADYRFVYYTVYGNYLGLASLAKGGAQQNLNAQIIKDYEIPLPPLPTQRKIAAILSDYDAAIANCRKQIALLEEAAQRLYREWFGDGKGEKKRLGEFVRFAHGKVITKAQVGKGQVPVIAAGLSPSCFTDVANVSAPCVTVSASGANAGHVWFHTCDIWASDCSYVSRRETPFVYFVTAYLKDHAQALRGMQKGSAQPHVHAKDIESLSFVEPSCNNIEEYESNVSPMMDAIGSLSQQIRSLTEARDRLLPKLMSGEVAV